MRETRSSYRKVARSGYSLVETIVALCLLLFVMAFVFGVFIQTQKGVRLSENHTRAAVFGRSILEDMRRSGFDAASSSSGQRVFSGLANGVSFSQVIKYSSSVQLLDTNKKLIWVTLSWHESTGDKTTVVESILQK